MRDVHWSADSHSPPMIGTPPWVGAVCLIAVFVAIPIAAFWPEPRRRPDYWPQDPVPQLIPRPWWDTFKTRVSAFVHHLRGAVTRHHSGRPEAPTRCGVRGPVDVATSPSTRPADYRQPVSSSPLVRPDPHPLWERETARPALPRPQRRPRSQGGRSRDQPRAVRGA